jgi:hypothetical protein
MLNRKFAILSAVLAAIAFAAPLSVSSSAQACPGVIATMLNNCQLDEIHRAVGSPLNQLVPQIPQPAAPAPISPAYVPGPQMQMAMQPMPYCATPVGTFLLPPAPAPNGAPCWHQNGPGGPVFNGQVVWQ